MSITASEMTPADIAAVTNGNGNCNGWGGDWSQWIIIFLIFAMFGWGNNGGGFFGGFGGNSGAADNYVLTSDFSQLSRQISDGFSGVERRTDSIINGLCDGFYTQAQLVNGVNTNLMQGNFGIQTAINGIGTQLASCCCDIREGISGVNYNLATQANGIGRQLERGFADTNYNLATQNCATLTAIDKVGDRIIDWMSNRDYQNLRDENQALRLAASQQAQNAYLIDQLGNKCPIPAYLTCNPNAPLNYSVNYGGCGCNG